MTRGQLVDIVADGCRLVRRSVAVGNEIERYFAGLNRVFEPIPPPPGTHEDRPTQTLSSAVNLAWHVNLSNPSAGVTPPRDTTMQVQFGVGDSVQRVYQVSYNLDTRAVQILAGGQVNTPEVPLWRVPGFNPQTLERTMRTLIGAQGFAQILGGVAATAGSSASGTAAVLQPSVGGQIAVHLDALTLPPGMAWLRSFQVIVQESGSITATSGQDTTAENNLTFQLTWTIPGS